MGLFGGGSAGRSSRTAARRDARQGQAAGVLSILEVEQARERREDAELVLAEGERLLGTDAQIAGELEGADLAPYTGRYEFTPGFRNLLAIPSGRKSIIGTKFEADQIATAEAGLNKVNDLMAQAEEAARAGDFEGAEKFRQQAEAFANEKGISILGGQGRDNLANIITFAPNIQDQAAANLSNPMAQTVGKLVKQGGEFLDPDSETSKRFKESLTEGAIEQIDFGERSALRGVVQERRQAERQFRDIGLSRGAGRSPYSERAVSARLGERFAVTQADIREQAAAERAGVISEANQVFEQFSREFARNSAAFGQAFLQNQAGIREQFQGAMDQLTAASIGALDQFISASQRSSELNRALGEQQREIKQAQNSAIGSLAIGGALLVAAPFAGAAVGAALGGGAAATAAGGAVTKTVTTAGGSILSGGFGGGGQTPSF